MAAETEEAATVLARLFAQQRGVKQVCMAWLPYDWAEDPLPAGQLCRLYLVVGTDRGRLYRRACGAPEPELAGEAMDIFGGDELYAVRILTALRYLGLNVTSFLAEIGEAASQLTELQHIDIVLVAGDWRSIPWPFTKVKYANEGPQNDASVFGKDWGEHAAGALCFMPLLDSFLPEAS